MALRSTKRRECQNILRTSGTRHQSVHIPEGRNVVGIKQPTLNEVSQQQLDALGKGACKGNSGKCCNDGQPGHHARARMEKKQEAEGEIAELFALPYKGGGKGKGKGGKGVQGKRFSCGQQAHIAAECEGKGKSKGGKNNLKVKCKGCAYSIYPP